MEPCGPNAEQIEYWNRLAGPSWIAGKARLDALIEPLGLATLERAELPAARAVLDVGCGTGQTSLELGRRVGAEGAVLGVDVSRPMLDVARAEARALGLEQVRFENADAQVHAFEPGRFDLVYSRFGVMFFADPIAAFANLRRALRPGGRLAFVCWQELGRNAWMLEPLAAIARHVELPPRPAPGSPGPFAFADADYVRGILSAAGFAEIGIESHAQALVLGGGGGLDAAVDQALQVGPAAAALRQASPGQRAKAEEAVRAALAAHAGPAGVRMPSAAWIVTARRPDAAASAATLRSE